MLQLFIVSITLGKLFRRTRDALAAATCLATLAYIVKPVADFQQQAEYRNVEVGKGAFES